MLSMILPPAVRDTVVIPTLMLLAILSGHLVATWLDLTAPDIIAAFLLRLILGIVLVSWIGTILAALGLFHVAAFAVVYVLLGVFALLRGRGHPAQAAKPSPLTAQPWGVGALLMILLGGACWLYGRPAESYMVTDDSAVYTIGSIVLARDGGLFFQPEPVLDLDADPSDVETAQAEALFRRPWTRYKSYVKQFFLAETSSPIMARHFGPFFQWTLLPGPVEIGFLPLPKVWGALASWLFGMPYAIWAAPFFGVAGLALLFGLARRLFGWPAGLGSVLLLGVSLPQMWFARFPISEIHTQTILIGGLYLAALALEATATPQRAHLLAAGSAITLAALTVLRFEALVMLAIATPLAVSLWRRDDPQNGAVVRTWLIALSASALLGVGISFGVAPYYFFTRLLTILSPRRVRFALALSLISASLTVLLWRSYRQRLKTLARTTRRYLPHAIALLWMLWTLVAAWQLVMRPWGDSLSGWLAQYWSPSGLLLSLAGGIWLLWRHRRDSARGPLYMLSGLAACFALLYSLDPLVTPAHPWAMRRLVPIVMPALALGAAVTLTEAASGTRSPRGRRWAACLAGLLLLLQGGIIAQKSWPLLWHQERKGLWRQLVEFSSRLPEGSLLLFDDGMVGKRLTQVMEMVFGHPSYLLQDSEAVHSDASLVDRLITAALAQGRSVYLVVTDASLAWHPVQWRLESIGERRFETPVVRQIGGRPPKAGDIAQHIFWADVYQVLPLEGETRMQVFATHVPAGVGSYPYLIDGFWERETEPDGSPFRWTKGEASIRLPWPLPDPSSPASLCLTLDISGWRPADVVPPQMEILAEGKIVAQRVLDPAAGRMRLKVPIESLANAGTAALDIRLRTGTWNAAQYGDSRPELGIIFYGLDAAPLRACTVDQVAAE